MTKTTRLRIILLCLLTGVIGTLLGSRAWMSYTAVPSVAAAPNTTTTQVGIQTSFAPVVEKALPAVVNISSSKVTSNNGTGTSPFTMDPFFRQFFGDNLGRQFRVPYKQWEHSLGSGVIVRPDGHILTNNHVIDGATDITVTLSDKRELKAKVVGTDSKTDLAVLKVDGSNLPTLAFADSSKMRVGDVVLAMGQPFGLGHTVTMGIISAKGRNNLNIEQVEDFIQTDAAINPGNSGGPLIDARGDLIGINTAIVSHGSGGNQGVGFAVPANMARSVMDQVLEHGKVVRGYIGVLPEDITPAMARAFHLTDTRGVLMGDVTAGSPAAQAGIQRGDVILEMDGEKLDDSNQLRLKVSMTAPGSTVHFRLLRDGKEQNVTVKLAEMPNQVAGRRSDSNDGNRSSSALEGVSVDDVNTQTLHELNLPASTKGVVVTDVADGSLAAMAGLRPGDVIVEVDRTRVSNVSDFDRELRRASGRTVLLLVNTGGTTRYVAIESR